MVSVLKLYLNATSVHPSGRMTPKHGTGLWYMGVYHDSNLRISWRCLHQNYQMNDRAIWFSIIGLAIVMGALELSHIQTHMTEKRPNYHLHKVVR